MKYYGKLAAAVALAGLCACQVQEGGAAADAQQNDQSAAAAQPTPVDAGAADGANPDAQRRARELALMFGTEQLRAEARRAAAQDLGDLRVLVDISDRELRLLRGDRVVATHDVAVGTSEWPTPTGEWAFHRVDLNPEWVPPKSESWAEDQETKAPGAPDNPMGRARLVYRMPNTVHGTDDLQSLGKASSHGSIRVANAVVLDLAQTLLKAGESWQGERWFRRMAENRGEEYQVELDRTIPIRVQE